MTTMASQITSLTVVYSTVIRTQIKENITKLRATSLCVGNSPMTGEFPAQRASYAKNVSIWWRHHEKHMNSAQVCLRNGMESQYTVIDLWQMKN